MSKILQFKKNNMTMAYTEVDIIIRNTEKYLRLESTQMRCFKKQVWKEE